MKRADGFTLVELLVVMLVIGILAAVALPVFLGQDKKAKDAEAKANARHVYGQIELCMSQKNTRTYAECDTNAELGDNTVTIGEGPGQVSIRKYSDPDNEYRVKSFSRSGGAFRIIRSNTSVTRNCTTPGEGGCRSDGTW